LDFLPIPISISGDTMVTKAELEAVMTAFHAKFEQLQVETDRKIAHSQEELVCVIIEQVNQHATSSREQLYHELSDRFVVKDSAPHVEVSPDQSYTLTADRRAPPPGSGARPPPTSDRY
jgi:hypothetical protein